MKRGIRMTRVMRGGPMGKFLTEEEKQQQPKVTKELLVRVFSYLKPYWKHLLLVIVCIYLLIEGKKFLSGR